MVTLALGALLALVVGACSTGDGSSGLGAGVGQYAPERKFAGNLVLVRDDLRGGESTHALGPTERAAHSLLLEACAGSRLPGWNARVIDEVAITDAGDAPVASSRVDIIDHPFNAASHLNVLRDVLIHCGDHPAVAGAAADAFPIDEAELDGLADDHVATTVTTIVHGNPTTSTLIQQRRGRVLVTTTSHDQARAIELAKSAAARLEKAKSYDVDE